MSAVDLLSDDETQNIIRHLTTPEGGIACEYLARAVELYAELALSHTMVNLWRRGLIDIRYSPDGDELEFRRTDAATETK